MAPRDSARPSRRPRESGTQRRRSRKPSSRGAAPASEDSDAGRGSHTLSADALQQLNRENVRLGKRARQESQPRPPRRRERSRYPESRPTRREERRRDPEYRPAPGTERRRERSRFDENREARRGRYSRVEQGRRERGAEEERDREDYYHRRGYSRDERHRSKRNRRAVSGALLEEGREPRGLRGGAGSSFDSLEKSDDYRWTGSKTSKKRRKWIYGAIGAVVLIVIIIVAVVVSLKKKKKSTDSNTGSGQSTSCSDVPSSAPSYLNPCQWTDRTDFNMTYTSDTVGDLPVIGLNSTWDDSAAANGNVPALDEGWGSYAKRPARGVNLGGWLSLEPFITPSLFDYGSNKGIIDEYTLCSYLGSSCPSVLERHYATFVTEQTFQEIADAGLDHVRISFSYWAVQTYDGDPYVFRTSWRYLLRGIEWARKYGLRVNLDLHGLPGSQNGWNHSGRQGPIGWLNGTDGDLNAQRSLDVHDRLSKFFAQDRYRNIISFYGLANEPRMTYLDVPAVLNWTASAYNVVRSNGVSNATIIFGDGFRGLEKWQGELAGLTNMALDVHQYVIFNTNQIAYNHSYKVQYACEGWAQQTEQSMDTSTGYGPTLVAEFTQADTDCAKYLTNVGWGNRWTGTYDAGDPSLDVLSPRCPLTSSSCECTDANAAASEWSDAYKKFQLMFAEAQMSSFEKGWGWFYWVWDTESSPQWSYKQGRAAGVLPEKAYSRSFDCSTEIPSFSDLPEYY